MEPAPSLVWDEGMEVEHGERTKGPGLWEHLESHLHTCIHPLAPSLGRFNVAMEDGRRSRREGRAVR